MAYELILPSALSRLISSFTSALSRQWRTPEPKPLPLELWVLILEHLNLPPPIVRRRFRMTMTQIIQYGPAASADLQDRSLGFNGFNLLVGPILPSFERRQYARMRRYYNISHHLRQAATLAKVAEDWIALARDQPPAGYALMRLDDREVIDYGPVLAVRYRLSRCLNIGETVKPIENLQNLLTGRKVLTPSWADWIMQMQDERRACRPFCTQEHAWDMLRPVRQLHLLRVVREVPAKYHMRKCRGSLPGSEELEIWRDSQTRCVEECVGGFTTAEEHLAITCFGCMRKVLERGAPHVLRRVQRLTLAVGEVRGGRWKRMDGQFAALRQVKDIFNAQGIAVEIVRITR